MLLSHFPSQGEGSSVHETIVLVSGQGILSLHFSLFIFFPAKVILLSQFCKLLGQKVGMRDSVDYNLNLNEVVVKSTAPKTRMKNGAMVTRIEGTVLESAGTAEEMLSRVPGMMRMGGQLQVIGKGTPIYYINGRKVQDTEELKRLKSHDIREVEVINSPGAAYDASTGAVVKIKTRRLRGEGLSGKLDANAAQAL